MTNCRRTALVALLLAGAAGHGCFWSKKPDKTNTPPPPPRSVSRKRAPANKPAAARKPKPQRKVRAATPASAASDTPGARGLTQILTPEQRKALSQELARSLSSAKRDVEILSKRSLTQAQLETKRLAQSFIAQAERARESDLAMSAGLARRAELLARSLIGATR